MFVNNKNDTGKTFNSYILDRLPSAIHSWDYCLNTLDIKLINLFNFVSKLIQLKELNLFNSVSKLIQLKSLNLFNSVSK